MPFVPPNQQRQSTDSLGRKIQLVESAATRLITAARQCNHITSVLHQLHWLPVGRRVKFKVVCMVHRSSSGQAPTYAADNISLVSSVGRCLLQSASDNTCHCTYAAEIPASEAWVLPVHVWNGLVSTIVRVTARNSLHDY